VKRARWVRWVLALVALVLMAGTVPALPAAWTDFQHSSSISDKAQPMSGWVQVTGCTRRTLPHAWKCDGDFIYANPLYAPHTLMISGVVVANDVQSHPRGASVSVVLKPDSHVAYLWGNGFLLDRVWALLAGLILCLIVIGLAPVAPRLKAGGWVLGLFLALGTWCLLPTLSAVWNF
jgi:hypothetical protein